MVARHIEETQEWESEETESIEYCENEADDLGEIPEWQLDNIANPDALPDWKLHYDSDNLVAAEYANESQIKSEIPPGFVYPCHIGCDYKDFIEEPVFFMQQILLNSGVGWRIDEDYMVMRINKCMELVKVKKTGKMVNGKNLLKLEENRIVLP